MIDQINEQCAQWIYFAMLASWRALPVFAIVAVLAIVLRKRVPARYLCWLWLIVIARLLLPFSIVGIKRDGGRFGRTAAIL